MSYSEIRLYVKSVKTVTGTIETEREVFGHIVLDHPSRVKVEGSVASGTFCVRQFAVETESRLGFVLSEDQQRIVEMIKKIGGRHSVEVEVVDVTKENVLRRVIQKELDRIRAFPTLIATSG